jgi:C-terminal processing protease CtpA/Prc
VRDADLSRKYDVEVTVDVYRYNPVLYSAIIEEGDHKIGYLVLENFDLDAQDFVVDIIQQLKDNAVTDLILDLRFNPGGAVAQSRYLASAIAGTAHLDDVFVKVDFRGGKHQDWKFRGGPNDEDGLGIAPDLGLKRLYVIGSENTASASELIINGLRGIDFPVYLYGSQTEGKNVGMTTTQTTYEGVRYLFSPITFRVSNAKGFGDYPDGFRPDVMVNNQNSSYADDKDNTFPYSFGDWGDMGFNVALRLAYEDIIGVTRSDMRSARSFALEPVILDHTGLMQPQHGRFGNVIYLAEETLN